MPADRIFISFEPRVLDYVCQVLMARPWSEVHSILTDINAQANGGKSSPLPEIVETSASAQVQ